VNNNLSFLYFLNQIFLSFSSKNQRRKPQLQPLAMGEAEYDAQVEQDDEGQIAHNESTVLSIHDQVIEIMRAQGVRMTIGEEKMPFNLFPKVSTNICMIF
jgi:hypothetical protein